MKLSPKALALTFGVLWGASMLLVGLASLAFEGYGKDFLEVMAAIYPGYKGDVNTIGNVLIGSGYGLVDGFIGGWVLAFVYNFFAKE